MLKKILPVLLAFSFLLTACGAEPAPPTMSPADIQNTAVAAAFTMVALTQAAIPTATPLPPTETPSPTPLPTFTPPPMIPTLDQNLILPTATTVSSDPNNCNRALNFAEAGPTKNVRVENTTKSQVNLSLTLWTPNPFGQCGSVSYVISKNEKRKIAIPSGSWYAYSWVLDPPSTGEISFYIGPSKSQDLLRLIIKPDALGWVGP
jgi:PBP1b-binding outer membrane lipoprotein LpoB